MTERGDSLLPEPKLPERIKRLNELANNLWWSWHQPARDLFRSLDYTLWRTSGHNPVKQLGDISQDKLQAAAIDQEFLNLYDSVMSVFDAAVNGQESWFNSEYPDHAGELIAFFSAEFAIHNSLPIYAGGLGILAGDICKEASDLGVPIVGVGFMYPQGYFRQKISVEGWQEENYRHLNFDEAPVNPVLTAQGQVMLTEVELENRPVFTRLWQVRVGRVNIYLLDTNVEENPPLDRQLSARLYTADREQRIQQEIILGIGGVRALRALGIRPKLWHANEGHTAFMMLERVREDVANGSTFDEAVKKVQASTIFTTHTPVPAGHDIFPVSLIEKYFREYSPALGADFGAFLKLGQQYGASDQSFNMTALGLKMAEHRNSVSKLHEEVTRRMWHGLWPEANIEEVPITHITNGIHVLSWVAPEMSNLYEKHLGRDISRRYDDTSLYEKVLEIPDEEIWRVREALRSKLVGAMQERVQKCWAEGDCTAQQIVALGALISPDVLTVGFVRRFAEYKRPGLIFQDIERLKRLVTNPWHPVQIIFAGKSHPADFASKFLLHNVYMMATAREFHGRISFVEDYDMHMARFLVQGVDVWLNTPRRLQEACGTSGMKAVTNGALHLSVRDGWWHEAYNGTNGWAVGDGPENFNPAEEDNTDAGSLYQLLEQQVVPLFYDRDRSGTPHGWVRMIKESIGSIVPFFSSRRMLKEYVRRMYLPSQGSSTT
ncbi:MAG: alpha-glucan family phosphorylase [Chloroflexi bacterium]|nr:alpha-glucan family phosphorylase [Chloroflexota bacterium]